VKINRERSIPKKIPNAISENSDTTLEILPCRVIKYHQDEIPYSQKKSSNVSDTRVPRCRISSVKIV